jgi:hypothetical protein
VQFFKVNAWLSSHTVCKIGIKHDKALLYVPFSSIEKLVLIMAILILTGTFHQTIFAQNWQGLGFVMQD